LKWNPLLKANYGCPGFRVSALFFQIFLKAGAALLFVTNRFALGQTGKKYGYKQKCRTGPGMTNNMNVFSNV